MKKKRKICPLCGGYISSGKVIFAVDLEFGVIVIRNVPAKVCTICGEEWIENKVAFKLEKIVDVIAPKKKECEILQYSKVA